MSKPCFMCQQKHRQVFCKQIRHEVLLAAEHLLYGTREREPLDFAPGPSDSYDIYRKALCELKRMLSCTLSGQEQLMLQALKEAVDKRLR